MDAELITQLDPVALAQVRNSNRDFFEKLWQDGGAAIGLLNSYFPGLVVPDHVRTEDLLVLVYEVDPVVPIPDLCLTDLGIEATLSFDRTPHKTFVPWEAIDGMRATRDPTNTPRTKPGLQLVP
jgi:hypothetical protein